MTPAWVDGEALSTAVKTCDRIYDSSTRALMRCIVAKVLVTKETNSASSQRCEPQGEADAQPAQPRQPGSQIYLAKNLSISDDRHTPHSIAFDGTDSGLVKHMVSSKANHDCGQGYK